MLILGINTASSITAIAVLEQKGKDFKVIGQSAWKSVNNEAEKLMPSIHELLKKYGKKFSEIKKVVVIKGPGSFTGLRIGVTVANTISYLNKAELYGVDSFSYLWNGIDTDKFFHELENIALLIFAGRFGVYYTKYSAKGGYVKSAKNINIEKLKSFLNKNKIKKVFGDISLEQKAEIKGIEFLKHAKFGDILKKLFIKGLKSAKMVVPVYIKKPGITPSKKKMF